MVKVEKKLEQMGLKLPEVSEGSKYWKRVKRAGNFLFIGTTGPWPITTGAEEGKYKGAILRDLTIEEGKFVCKMCVLSVLSAIKNEIGDLDKVDKIVKLEAYVVGIGGDGRPYNEITEDGIQLLLDLYGDDGRPTRSVTPANDICDIAVELDMVVYIKDE
jgi:hypothetical protein